MFEFYGKLHYPEAPKIEDDSNIYKMTILHSISNNVHKHANYDIFTTKKWYIMLTVCRTLPVINISKMAICKQNV